MSSCVYYKFKSKKESSKISFDGSAISVKDLRERILLHSGLKANDMILKIEKQRDASAPKDAKLEEYKDDESVKKFSTVIVSRMPCPKREVTRAKIANPEIMSRRDPYKALSKEDPKDTKFHEIQKNSKLYELDLSEEDKINLMMKQSTEGYYLDKNPRSRGQPPGPPPPNYVCHKCKMSGHYFNQCPGIKDKEGNPVDLKNLKRPTGIPQDFLVEVAKETPGAYLTKDGRYALPIKDRDAFAQGKKEKRPFSEEENPAYIPTERKPVDMIVCPLCQRVMRDAVFISCCGYTYCQECLTDYIFNTDVKGCGRCPNCNSVVESAESFTENPTVREFVRKYNSGVTDLFKNTSKSAFQVKNESGTVPSMSVSSSAPIKTKPTSKPVDAPTPSTSGSSPTPALPASQSPPTEDDSSAKPKETSAIRGPFVDGRRVLKPKPPPEVVLSRRSDTLKTEANPTVPADKSDKPKTETNQLNAPEIELDLGIDETTDSFLNENIKTEPVSIVDVKEEPVELPSTAAEEPSGTVEDDASSQVSADKEIVSGETISVHTFDKRYTGHERNSSARPTTSGPLKREQSGSNPVVSVPMAKPPPSARESGSSKSVASGVPVGQSSQGSMLRTAGGLVIPPFGHYRVVPAVTQAASQPLHPRSHLSQSVIMGSQFPQNHYFQMYNSACLYDIAHPHQGNRGPTVPASALINGGAASASLPIANPEVVEAPILSEDQFNILQRNFLAEEAKRHRRRHRSRDYSRIRDRYSRSPPSHRHRGGSRGRRSRSPRRNAQLYPKERHRRSPRSYRQDSPHSHSRHTHSLRGAGSWRDSNSPVPYGGSISSGHKMSPYRVDCHPRERSRSPGLYRKRERTASEPRQDRPSSMEPTERRLSPHSHRRPVSPPREKASSRHYAHLEFDSRQAYPDDWNSRSSHEFEMEDLKRELKPARKSGHSTSSTRSSVTGEQPALKRARRPSLDGRDVGPYPAMKQSRSQASLPAYHSESMHHMKRDYHSKDKDSRSQNANVRRHKEESRQTVHNNAGVVDDKKDRAKLSVPPANIWYSKTKNFLEKLGIPQSESTEEMSDSSRSKPKKSRRERASPEPLESVPKCLPLMEVVVQDPSETKVRSKEVKVVKPKKDKADRLKLSKSSVHKRSTRYPSDPEVKSRPELSPEPTYEPPVKVRPASPVPEVIPEVKKKSKKEKKDKKEKKKKKKRRKEDKDHYTIEAPEVEILPPVELESETYGSDQDLANDNSASALIPPPSKWELELDDHMNEFEEESKQEKARSNSRIPSLISSVNYRRVSVEEEEKVEMDSKKAHKAKKEAKRHKKKKRERH